jgi:hypothetical protein
MRVLDPVHGNACTCRSVMASAEDDLLNAF